MEPPGIRYSFGETGKTLVQGLKTTYIPEGGIRTEVFL
jgi:hypothetical protein